VRRIVFPSFSLTILIIFALTACQQLPAPATSGAPSSSANVTWEDVTVVRDTLAKTAPADELSAPPTPSVLEAPETSVTPESNLAPPPPAISDPDDFVEKPADDLTAAFGAPSMLRREGQVQIWQYKLTGCVVDFFIYADGPLLVVKYAAMRSRFLGGQLDGDACKMALYEIRQKQP